MTTPPAEVTATEFRNNIAEIFTNAKYGHPTVITNNAKPIAKVVHPDADEGELLARAEQAEAERDRLKIAAQAALDKPHAARTVRMLCAALAATESRCTCHVVSIYEGPSYPEEDCPIHGNPAVLDLAATESPAPAPTTRTETA